MRRALLLILLLGLPTAARASASALLEEFVPESDVIVVGTLRDVEEHTAEGTDYGEGRIEVREVIWGDAAPGDSLTLKWENGPGFSYRHVEHKGNAGREGIWLLTRDGDAFAADDTERFFELSECRKVEAALRNSTVVLRADRAEVKPGEPLRFSVVYRNASRTPRTFPGLAFEGGDLHVSAGSALELGVTSCDGSLYGVPRRSGRVVRDAALAPVKVLPGEERRVELDLGAMLAAGPQSETYYTVYFEFRGLPPTNVLSFHVGEPSPPPVINYSRPFRAYEFTEGPPRTGAALVRAGLAALLALILFPFFYRLRATRLARAAHGVQKWQI